MNERADAPLAGLVEPEVEAELVATVKRWRAWRQC